MTQLIDNPFYLILLVIGIFILYRILKDLLEKKPKRKIRRKRRKKVFLTAKTKAKAERKFKRRLDGFKRKHKRKPTHNELFRMVIQASHDTIIYRKGHSGHWGRQKVRKYLLEKHKIVKNYRMR